MKTKLLFGAVALFVTMAVASCKKEPGEPKVVFPDMEEVSVSAGDRDVLAFDAAHDWTLKVTGNVNWFRFVDNDTDTEGETEISGVAGEASVKYYVSDADLADFVGSTAELEITMEGKNKMVFKISRTPRISGGAVMYTKPTLGDEVPTPISAIEFIGETDLSVRGINVSFAAKFDWKVLSVPEGILVQDKYNDDGTVKAFEGSQFEHPTGHDDFRSFSLAQNRIAYALPDDAKVVICNRQDESETIEFPVIYAGITNDNKVRITPARITGTGETFSKEGYLLQGGGIGTPYDADPDPYVYVPNTDTLPRAAVAVKDMDYSLFVVEYEMSDGGVETARELTGDDCWVNISDDGEGNITFGVDENTDFARTAYILVLPPAKANNPQLNSGTEVGNYIFDKWTIKVSQEGKPVIKEGDPIFAVNWGASQIPVESSAISQNYSPVGNLSHNKLPENPDMVWCYRFTDDDIVEYDTAPTEVDPDPDVEGDEYFTYDAPLWIAPLDFPSTNDNLWFVLENYPGVGSLASVNKEIANVNNSGATIRGAKITPVSVKGGMGAALLFFWRDKATFDANERADAAIWIVQNVPAN